MIFTYTQRSSDCTRITAKSDDGQEARVDIYAPTSGVYARPARVTYPIMGDDSPEFAETMAAALIEGAKMARILEPQAE